MRIYVVLCLLTLGFSLYSYAQVGNKDFKTITRTITDYYDRVGKDKPGYKQFKRWEWYHETRLGPGGLLVDNFSRNMQALRSSSANRAASSLSNAGSWSFMGPNSVASSDKGVGRVNRIAFHPTNENILYAASATGGLWISSDAGSSWFSYSEGIPNMTLSGVAVHHTNPNILYILTGDADSYFGGARAQFAYGKSSTGVLKSFDGGFTWYQTALNWAETDGILGYKLLMHPTDPDILFIAASNGIWRTVNGGNSWTLVDNTAGFFDMEFQPGNPSVVYASGTTNTDVVFKRSTNTGLSFSTAYSRVRQNDASNRSAIAVTPANAAIVYLLLGPATGAGSFHGVYRSTDGGLNFTQRSTTPNILGRTSDGSDADDQEHYDLALAVSPTSSASLACGGIRLWTSTNSGTSFTFRDNGASATNYYHVDIHDLAYHPLNNSKLYMCADGGVYLSTDNGATWTSKNNGLAITQYYKIAHNPNTVFNLGNIMIGGTQDNGTNKRLSSGSTAFEKISGADGMDCFIDPDGAAVYVVSYQLGEFLYSTNSGSSFEFVCNESTLENTLNIPVTSRWLTPVAEVTGNTTQFVMGYSPVMLATRVTTGTYAFSAIGRQANRATVDGRSFVKTARGNANRIFAGFNKYTGTDGDDDANIIWTTTNQGSSWNEIYYEEDNNGAPVTDMAFNPSNGNEIWLTFGGYTAGRKVLYSPDGGTTIVNVSGSLPNVPINCIVYDGSNGTIDDRIYIGTDIGVFYRDNNLGDWVPFSNGLPVVEITDLEIHEANGMLRAGTYGRGMWESALYSGCVNSITLTTANTEMYKPYSFQASQSINSTALHLGTGANVFYKAGSNVILTPGFQAGGAANQVFEAAVGPCGGGVPNRITTAPQKGLKGFLMN